MEIHPLSIFQIKRWRKYGIFVGWYLAREGKFSQKHVVLFFFVRQKISQINNV
jgi:hypothetical protein